MSKIITRNVYPPIPDRRFDWCAYHDGDEENASDMDGEKPKQRQSLN